MVPKKWQRTIMYFVAAYALLFFFQFAFSGIGLLSAWSNTPSFYLLPIAGFFLAFFGMPELEKFLGIDLLNSKQAAFAAIGIIILILAAWHIALTFYFQNNAYLQLGNYPAYGEGGEVPFSENCKLLAVSETTNRSRNLWTDSLGIGSCLAGEQFWPQLQQSAYLVFCLGAVLGIAFNVIERKKFSK